MTLDKITHLIQETNISTNEKKKNCEKDTFEKISNDKDEGGINSSGEKKENQALKNEKDLSSEKINEIEDLKINYNYLKDKIEDLKKDLNKNIKKSENLKKEKNKIIEKLQKLQNENSSLKKDNMEINNCNKKLKEYLRRIRNENYELSTKVIELEQKIHLIKFERFHKRYNRLIFQSIKCF